MYNEIGLAETVVRRVAGECDCACCAEKVSFFTCTEDECCDTLGCGQHNGSCAVQIKRAHALLTARPPE